MYTRIHKRTNLRTPIHKRTNLRTPIHKRTNVSSMQLFATSRPLKVRLCLETQTGLLRHFRVNTTWTSRAGTEVDSTVRTLYYYARLKRLESTVRTPMQCIPAKACVRAGFDTRCSLCFEHTLTFLCLSRKDYSRPGSVQ